ncbi:glycine cleavage system protein GcvH [Bacteriovoracaceae bacterium]|nr:glycine cleavage system protein GcvH [Bacteriovoracaceae bacterium]
MNTPSELFYTKEHEWVKLDGDTATIGITDYAQSSLGDIVFVELPESGMNLSQEQTFGVVESIKSVSDLFSPITGEVIEINNDLNDAPEKLNEDPYKNWIVKLKVSPELNREHLLNAETYNDYCLNNN